MTDALTLVIPCYNEARRIDLAAFVTFLAGAPSVSLIFVDDGSTDGTRELLEPLTTQFAPRVRVSVLPANRGKAEAVRAGLLSARAQGAPIVGFWDADLATPLDAVVKLLNVLETHRQIDWVFGARVQLLGRHIERRALRHYLGRIFATAASLVLAMPVYDTQCGAKLFRGTTDFDAVISQPFVSRWVFDVEMIARFSRIRNRAGASPAADAIYEYPLARWADVGTSKVRSWDFLVAFVDLVQIWRARS